MTCPRCKSKNVDVHVIGLTPYHWYLCFDCSYVWDESGYEQWRKERVNDGDNYHTPGNN